MKYYYLIILSLTISSAQAETFPAKLTCNTGEQITLKVTGPEQRLIYTSSLYGVFHGYLDVFKGLSPGRQYEALASIHGMARYRDNPLHFTLLMKRTNGEMNNDSITYRYTYLKDKKMINEEGYCSPIKDGGFIEGSKDY
ncbi:hypothetical protein ABRP77_14200 [Pectobacterium odoriferum]|uniref:hypothetical protein n=1 Tax=Pectobacterium odoriferum TaxID=78398 RepID=UPI00202D2ADF|nr:hypothetical protein [Pectobacterium carotovorum]MCL6398369.1 hypothetical protein [Pectobacterium carotovorum subsp. carotovorum]